MSETSAIRKPSMLAGSLASGIGTRLRWGAPSACTIPIPVRGDGRDPGGDRERAPEQQPPRPDLSFG